jgi:hypothetical protein
MDYSDQIYADILEGGVASIVGSSLDEAAKLGLLRRAIASAKKHELDDLQKVL